MAQAPSKPQVRRALFLTGVLIPVIALSTFLAWFVTRTGPAAQIAAGQEKRGPTAANTPIAVAAGGDWIGFHGGGPLLGEASPLGAPPFKMLWKLRAEDIGLPPAGTAAGAATLPATGPSTAPASSGPGHFEASAAIVSGFVYVGDTAGALRAIDLRTGAVKWTYRSDDGFMTTPLILDNRVILGDEGGMLHAVSADKGLKLWTFDSGSPIHSSANYLGASREHIVFGNDGADIYCLDAATGQKVWEQKAGDRINGAPAVANGSALVSGCDAQLRALKGTDGKEEYAVDLGALCPGSAAVAGDRIVLGTDQGRVLCLSAATQKPLWTFTAVGEQAMVYSSPAVSDGIVVFGARDRRVYGLNLSDGKKVWDFPTRGDVDSSPAISAGRVYVGSKDKRLYCLDLKTGKDLGSFAAGRGITASPAIAEGVLVIGDTGGNLFCLQPGGK